MYALEDLCAKLDSTRDRVAAMSLSIAIACNPHLTLALYRKYEPHLREYTNRILENSYAVMDFIRAKVVHPRLFKRSSISAAWIDPQYVIENKDLFHKHVVDSMKLVNMDVLRAFDLRPRDMLLKFYAAGWRGDEHMPVDRARTQQINHRVYLPCVLASWALLCALTAAATPDDINALYVGAPLYDENNNERGKVKLADTRGLSFMCPVCAAECPDAPLDAAEEHELYRYKTFWKYNRQITCAFIAARAEHVNWTMLSANPAIWSRRGGSDDNTILSVYHAQLEPAVVATHAPMRLLQTYYGDLFSMCDMRENPTCPRRLVDASHDLNTFARIALPRAELEQLF